MDFIVFVAILRLRTKKISSKLKHNIALKYIECPINFDLTKFWIKVNRNFGSKFLINVGLKNFWFKIILGQKNVGVKKFESKKIRFKTFGLREILDERKKLPKNIFLNAL